MKGVINQQGIFKAQEWRRLLSEMERVLRIRIYRGPLGLMREAVETLAVTGPMFLDIGGFVFSVASFELRLVPFSDTYSVL